MPTRSLNMSETPQNDETTIELDSAAVEINDSVPHSESGEQVQAESDVQVDEVALAKQKANEAFNKQYGEKKQLERDLAAERERLAKFEQAERERQAAQVNDLPEWPDEFDDDFEQKKADFLEAQRRQSDFNAEQRIYAEQQRLQQQQAAQAKQIKIQESMTNYSNKALELGIKQDELQAAGNTVANYGLSDDLVMHILADSEGPLITKHLAANPQDGYQLASMSPFEVGSFLDGVKSKASALKPKTSSAPPPPTNLQGNGVDTENAGMPHIAGNFE